MMLGRQRVPAIRSHQCAPVRAERSVGDGSAKNCAVIAREGYAWVVSPVSMAMTTDSEWALRDTTAGVRELDGNGLQHGHGSLVRRARIELAADGFRDRHSSNEHTAHARQRSIRMLLDEPLHVKWAKMSVWRVRGPQNMLSDTAYGPTPVREIVSLSQNHHASSVYPVGFRQDSYLPRLCWYDAA